MASSEAPEAGDARRCLCEMPIERGRAKRGRRMPLTTTSENGATTVGVTQTVRPSAAERVAAECVIAAIAVADKSGLKPPLMDQRAAKPKPHIVALALAIYFGQQFESEAKAKIAFNVGKGTDVGKGTAWQRTLHRLFEHEPVAKSAAAACFLPAPATAGAAKAPRLEAPASAAAHTLAAAAPTALVHSDLEWQWWRRGFDAARAEQAEYVKDAAAAAIAAAEEKAANFERLHSEACREQAVLEMMLEHVVENYLEESDRRRSTAASRAAYDHGRAERAEAACDAYEDAFDEYGLQPHPDPEIDDVLRDEREKLLDARAHAMAKARQPLPQQVAEESLPWTYLKCGGWLDVLREETIRTREREDAECERDRERALSILRAPGSVPGGE